MKTIFWKLNFGILPMRARVRAIITGKLLWHGFLEIKFWIMNEILEISENIYFPLYSSYGSFSWYCQ